MTASFANRPLQIALDGIDLDAKMLRCAASAFVRQTLDAPSLAEICFAEPPEDGVKALRYGAALSLRTDSGAPLFKGEITTLEHQRDGADGHIVRLRAYDHLHRLRKKQRARALANIPVSDLVAQAASDLGLESAAAEAGPTRRLSVQYEYSDLEFIVELAAESGLHLYLDGDVLRLMTLAGEGEPIALKVGRELASVRSVASVETMRRNVKTQAWNVLRTTVMDATVSLARQDAEDMRSIDTSAFADIGMRTLYNRVAADVDEAKGFTQADMDRAASGEVIIEGNADGDPRLRPGRAIKILGIDNDVDGQYAVTQALHLFTAGGGYITEFTTAPPARAARARGPLFTFGRVFDVSDPEKLSRARARLPLLGDLESDWMPVVVASAGKNKGFAVMPENGDNVLILFPDGNPAYGIVLGGLYGEDKAPGLADAGERPFVFRTANGQTFTLDSANALARLETSGGDRFELGPKGTKLHATHDILIEAPGQTVTIRAKAIEFEEG